MLHMDNLFKEGFIEYIRAIAGLTRAKTKEVTYKLKKLQEEANERKRYAEQQRQFLLQKQNHNNNVRMLQRLLSEANNSIPADIRVASLLSDKSLNVEYSDATYMGKLSIYIGKRLDKYTCRKYREGLETALYAINEDAFNDFSELINKAALDYQTNNFNVISGYSSPSVLNPDIYWSKYISYYSTFKQKLIEIEVVSVEPTPSTVEIVFRVKKESEYNLRWWWPINSGSFMNMLSFVMQGGSAKSQFMLDKENLGL